MEKRKEFLEVFHDFQKLTYKAKPVSFMSHGEFIMLVAIERFKFNNEDNKNNSWVTVSQLASKLKSSKSATSKMLNIVEEKDYVERFTDKSDRRMVYVRLTEMGQEILNEAKREMERFSNNIIEKMGEDDSENLIILMKKLQIIIQNELSKKG